MEGAEGRGARKKFMKAFGGDFDILSASLDKRTKTVLVDEVGDESQKPGLSEDSIRKRDSTQRISSPVDSRMEVRTSYDGVPNDPTDVERHDVNGRENSRKRKFVVDEEVTVLEEDKGEGDEEFLEGKSGGGDEGIAGQSCKENTCVSWSCSQFRSPGRKIYSYLGKTSRQKGPTVHAAKERGITGGAGVNGLGVGLKDNCVQEENRGRGLQQELVNSLHCKRHCFEDGGCTKRKSPGCDTQVTPKVKLVEQQEDGKQTEDGLKGPEQGSDVERVAAKLRYLKARYRELKGFKEQTGDNSVMWLFFEELDAVLGAGFNDTISTPTATCPNKEPSVCGREGDDVDSGRVEGEWACRAGAEEGDGSGRSGFGSARWRGQHVKNGQAGIDLNRPGAEMEVESDPDRRPAEVPRPAGGRSEKDKEGCANVVDNPMNRDSRGPSHHNNKRGAEKQSGPQTNLPTMCTNPKLASTKLEVEFRDIILAMFENRRKIAKERIAHEGSEAKRVRVEREKARAYLREEREREMLFDKEMMMLEFEKDRKKKQCKWMEMKAERTHVECMLKMENERLQLNLQVEEKKLEQEEVRLQQEEAKYKVLLIQRELQGGDSAMAMRMDDDA